jgi:hypothetical protein
MNPLNSPVETGVRVLMVLTSAFPEHLDLNQLVLLDHGVLHSADLGGPPSLHPPVPKSASVLWAVADAGTQSLIGQAHHAAVAEMVAFMEREVAATRTGATGRDGAVAQVDVTGLIATGYDHYDSRAGDPHLHTHVVISNKVQTVLSLGIAVASSIGTKSLIVPENGYTGINLPLRPNRGGALSTRSTHPETFRRVAEILPRLNVTISNPFEWMTKGGSAAACVIHLVQYAD